MSSAGARPYAGIGRAHPIVLSRRREELLLIAAATVLPLAAGLAISVALPNPSLLALVTISAGAVAVVGLMVSPRYPLTLTLVALYLGLLAGPVKLTSGANEVAAVLRDVFLFAVVLGALLRIVVKRERIVMPPLSAWILGFCALVLVQGLNPNTASPLKALGGLRQQLEWVPFFFFGYALMRSTRDFRRLFILLGVLALGNGLVSAYQARLSPGQLASWGPGYRELVVGFNGKGGRTFSHEGTAFVRPPGLGTDSGFGGGVGAIALPGTLALLATGSLRRRWPALLLCIGALLAVTTGLGRLQAVAAVFSVAVFAALAFTAGRRPTRTVAVILGVIVLAIPAGIALISIENPGILSRYENIPSSVKSGNDTKLTGVRHIPAQLEKKPFGIGLGTTGAAGGFGGKHAKAVEGEGVAVETSYNLLAVELGLPGLLLYVALTIRVLMFLPGLRRFRDSELRLDLAAMFASFIAFTFAGFSGPTIISPAFGPFFWFFVGTVAYWFAGPGRRQLSSPVGGTLR